VSLSPATMYESFAGRCPSDVGHPVDVLDRSHERAILEAADLEPASVFLVRPEYFPVVIATRLPSGEIAVPIIC